MSWSPAQYIRNCPFMVDYESTILLQHISFPNLAGTKTLTLPNKPARPVFSSQIYSPCPSITFLWTLAGYHWIGGVLFSNLQMHWCLIILDLSCTFPEYMRQPSSRLYSKLTTQRTYRHFHHPYTHLNCPYQTRFSC